MSDFVERPVDGELLSAYLDGQVTEAERADVEAQLAVSAAWREELASLRWTVGLLGSVPQAPLPRSFELPIPTAPVSDTAREVAAAAGAARPTTPAPPSGARPVARPAAPRPTATTPWLSSVLRAASAVAVALLLAVVGLDVWQTGALRGRPAPMAAQAPASAPAPGSAAIEAPKAAAAPTTAPAADARKAGPAAAPQAQAPSVLQNPAAAPTVFPQGGVAGAPPQGSGGGGGGNGGAGGLGAGAEGPGQESIPLGDTPTAASSAAASAASTDNYPVSPATQTPPPARPPWRPLELTLAVIALALGLGAWLAGRRGTG